MQTAEIEPSRDCPFCPRLKEFRDEWREREPSWFNAPVPTFFPDAGSESVEFLIVGLGPGVRGANRTGRPFTGDYAGELLYSTLIRFGFAHGRFLARPDDGLQLARTAITNAVRCVPPQNKPTSTEINTCRQFLSATLSSLPNLRAVLTLGAIAHQSTVKALGERLAVMPFKHGGRYRSGDIELFSSYHCSRYNTNTGVLTEKMFVSVFAQVEQFLATSQRQEAPSETLQQP